MSHPHRKFFLARTQHGSYGLALSMLLLTIGIAGCGPQLDATGTKSDATADALRPDATDAGEKAETAQKDDTIAMLYHTGSDAASKAFRAGARDEAEQAKLKLEWLEVAPGEVADQISKLESALDEGYGGICICPLERDALLPAVRSALKQSIPIVICERSLTKFPPDNPDEFTLASTDHFHSGQVIAEQTLEELSGGEDGENVAVLLIDTIGSDVGAERRMSIEYALKSHRFIDLIDSADLKDQPTTTIELLNAMTKDRKRTERMVIIALNPEDGREAVVWKRSWETNRRDDSLETPSGNGSPTKSLRPTLLAFGAWPGIESDLEDGQLSATVLEDPYMTGRSTIMAIASAMSGKREFRGLITTGGHLLTPENRNDSRSTDLLPANMVP